MWTLSDAADRKLPPLDPILTWVSDVNYMYPFVGTLLALMVFDVVIGTIAAFKKKTLSSTISHVGMSKKAVKLLLIATGRVIEPYTSGMPVGSMIASTFIVTESLSIIENARLAGVPMPQFFTDALTKVKSFAGIPADQSQPMQVNIGKASSVDIHTTDKPETNGVPRADSVIIRETQLK